MTTIDTVGPRNPSPVYRVLQAVARALYGDDAPLQVVRAVNAVRLTEDRELYELLTPGERVSLEAAASAAVQWAHDQRRTAARG